VVLIIWRVWTNIDYRMVSFILQYISNNTSFCFKTFY